MKTSAFEQWRDRLELPTAIHDFLHHLHTSLPVHRVLGRLLNVCGTYASREMGVSIQFESHRVNTNKRTISPCPIVNHGQNQEVDYGDSPTTSNWPTL